MKKFICVITAATLSAGLAVFGAGCGDNNNYSGDLSVKKYGSVKDAATDCIRQEVLGETTDAAFKAYESGSKLSEKQIEKLNLTDEERKELTAAEEGTIIYTTALRGAEFVDSEMEVFILTFGDEYAYYIPEPETGENMTRSYFYRVTNAQYDNFTLKTYLKQSTTTNNTTESTTVQLDLKYTGTELWFKMSMPDSKDPENKNQTMEVFAADNDNALKMWMSINGSDYIVSTTTEYANLEDMLNQAVADVDTSSELDHTFFVKTDFGFGVRDDRIESLASRVFKELNLGYDIDFKTMDYNYYVNDGMVTSMTANCSLTTNVYDKTISMSMNALVQITDVGTTEITLPTDDETI